MAVSLTLRELDLSGNKFNDACSDLLGKWISDVRQHAKLQSLSLRQVSQDSDCYGPQIWSLPASIAPLCNAASCSCTGAKMMHILQPMHSLPNLRDLNISGNRLEPSHVPLLTTMLEVSASLWRVNVSDCGMLPSSLQCLK